MSTLLDGRIRATDAFVERHGVEPTVIVRAPGRVNLIGEHTDYNDGFVLPMAIPHSTWIAARPREDRVVELYSEGYGLASIDTDRLERERAGWTRYVEAVAWVLSDHEPDRSLLGWDGVVATDVPAGASLSSSASFELASMLVFDAVRGTGRDPVDAARLAQRAENEWVGVPCGIMDQLISATATAGHAKLIDCRSLQLSDHPLPDSVEFIIMDTGSRRELVESEYADRRAACERVARQGGVNALRDLELDTLELLPLEATDRRRAIHVITENTRTTAAAQALASGDMITFGRLMSSSHASLRDDFSVSGPELDLMVDAAEASVGCLGARMTGAGFAGCAVALVEAGDADRFAAEVTERYEASTDLASTIHRCRAEAGAEIVLGHPR